MFFGTTKEIWKTMRQTYYKVKDASVIFESKIKINSIKQGQSMAVEYYNKMRGLWLELDHITKP